MTFHEPMLAASLMSPRIEHTNDNILSALCKRQYPVLATLKVDGIRGLRFNKSLLSRTLKTIPNDYIRERSLVMPGGFDMEICNPELEYSTIESIVMSKHHARQGEIQFHVLDWYGHEGSYAYRMAMVQTWMNNCHEDFIKFQSPIRLDTPAQILDYFLFCEEHNGEGICFRTPDSPYKQGRSTLKQQWLVKLARYVRTEVTIIGFIEQQENTNEESYNSVGKMDRSSHKDGMVGKGTLGAFICQTKSCLVFKVGTGVGLTDKIRQDVWNNRSKYLGRQITIKSKTYGTKIKPRSPIFVGFREEGY
jgi:DNA ligase-1